MPSNGYFDTPFALEGTRTTIPDALQPSGAVSYEEGYGVDYTYPPTNPNYKPIDQASFNQLMYDITSALQSVQQGSAPAFITSAMNGGTPFSYPAYASVTYEGVEYQSLVSNNTTTPPSSSWFQTQFASTAQFVAGTSTGTTNAQVWAALTPSTGFSLTANGQSVTGTAGFTNTGATTFNIAGTGATNVYKLSGGSLVPLAGGEIVKTDSITLTVNTGIGGYVLNSPGNFGALAFLNIGAGLAADGFGNLTTTNNISSGTILDYAGGSVPSGYLLCTGAAVSRSTYATLFAAIGTAWGSGDGSTTFNLPDLRGKVLAGLDNMGGTAAGNLTSGGSGIASTTLGASGGNQLTQQHTHTASVTDSGHQHGPASPGTSFIVGTGSGTSNTILSSSGAVNFVGTTSNATTGIGVSNSNYGSGESQNVQPTAMVNKMIKT